MRGPRKILTLCTVVLAAGLFSCLSRADSLSWGGGNGDWTDSSQWSPAQVPAAGDIVTVDGGSVLLTNATADLGSLTMSGGTLTFSNWTAKLTATNVTINGGTVTHAANSDTNGLDGWTPDARVWIACSNLTLASGASIAASDLGYASPVSGPTAQYGYGPGAGQSRVGGGHGGHGGWLSGVGGGAYGSLAAPEDPGSGGGRNATGGGYGGGVVRIDAAGAVTIDGTIAADGKGGIISGGGGAGGSVTITCLKLAGTGGTISADGGSGDNGGGGGRIAILYDTAAQAAAALPGVTLSAAGGPFTRSAQRDGDIGTLYFPDGCLLDESLSCFSAGKIHMATPTVTLAGLTVSNKWIRFADEGLHMTVTGNVTVAGASGQLELGGNGYDFVPSRKQTLVIGAMTSAPVFVVTGDLTLEDGADLYVFAGKTNGTTDYGLRLDVSGTVTLAADSWIYPYSDPTNGGCLLMRVGRLDISPTTAGIDAAHLGYRNTAIWGGTGWGPGAGTRHTGGGYGGEGGGPDAGGGPYGSSNAPVQAGSAGGTRSSEPGGHGGGLIRIEAAETVTLGGSLTANGETIGNSGGGAGGGIYLRCHSLAGPGGTMSATGGDADRGGGGGGRIAVWYAYNTTAAATTTDVSGGIGVEGNGETGTVVWVNTTPTITNIAADGVADTTASLVGNLTSTGQAPSQVWCFWGTNDALGVKGSWGTNDLLGLRGEGLLTNELSGLDSGTLYYYRFYASNSYGGVWAAPSAFFSTSGGGITLNNDGGATALSTTSATLRGEVVIASPDPDTYVCWGDDDPGGADTSQWDHVEFVGTLLGSFAKDISGLLANETYYYRCYATNDTGPGWAPTVSNFTTRSPTIWISDAMPVTEGDAGTTDLVFTVTLSTESAEDVGTDFASSNGWALSPGDYTAVAGQVVVPAGQLTASIAVPVIGDSVDEYPDEDLYVHLTSPSNAAAITVARARGVITDDDATIQTKTWHGTGDWTSRTNWSPQGEPGAGDNVAIGSGSCSLTHVSAALASLGVTGGTLTFSNWTAKLTATTVTIDGGTVRHAANSDTNGADGWTPDARVWIACSNLTVASGSSIEASESGYGSPASGPTAQYGYGPGAGQSRVGGGHGGHGGWVTGTGGGTYGSVTAPDGPGSGGGRNSLAGGWGGGAVRIDTEGTVTVDGTIAANGGGGVSSAGGGSGGSVAITCLKLAGTGGTVSADGGSGDDGGGGGRIAVVYDTIAQAAAPVPDVSLSANGGAWQLSGQRDGDIGTVYLPDSRLLGIQPFPITGQVRLSTNTLALAELTISNRWVRFSEPGLQMTVNGDVNVLGSNGRLGFGGDGYDLHKRGSTLVIGDMTSAPVVTVTGDLTLEDGADLYAFAAPSSGMTNEGLTIYVAGAVTLSSNSWIYPHAHPTNGSPVLLRVGSLDISPTNAGINADYTGFRSTPLYGPQWGYGPGGGYRHTGGGYGGAGGGPDAGGGTYGSSNAPVHAGSAGGTRSDVPGGYGGGRVSVEARGTVMLNGVLSANGESVSNSGGGSGGAIHVRCSRIAGDSGTIRAQGGDGVDRGGGGGGRIAIWFSSDQTSGMNVDVTGGTGTEGNGEGGTIVWGQLAARGTLFTIR